MNEKGKSWNPLKHRFLLLAALGVSHAVAAAHVVVVDTPVLTPEEGLLLGNGDLSVSVYQAADRIIWRLGKNDVWDRRLDLSDDPRPADIGEIARGIRDEGWKCGPYGNGKILATRGTQNPKRMREICQGTPPSYKHRPYPCPKPVGELSLHLPPDPPGLRVRQSLDIESAELEIAATWQDGTVLHIHCFIPPAPNVLVLRWQLKAPSPSSRFGRTRLPLWFSLERWADPPISSFAARFSAESRVHAFQAYCDPKATPLPPPRLASLSGLQFIAQHFPPTPLFPRGFQCLVTALAPGAAVICEHRSPGMGAGLQVLPESGTARGALVVAVATSSDPGGAEHELQRIASHSRSRFEQTIQEWEQSNRRSAAKFWSRSKVEIADPFVENLWYETYHARRCAYRPGTPPPGLFLPSTVRDYSLWHGDYHTNYNYQAAFWGDYTANHIDLGDAYFSGMKHLLQIGRKIAREYYHARGAFIQLSGFPIHALDDPLGAAPMGRMAYMTGWAAIQYWRRYRYTLDRTWLRTTGYPAIRDCALFYTDFLKKGADGLYHAFPSNQGEEGFSGNPKDYTDRPQVIAFARYCLQTAIQAARVLRVDPKLQRAWKLRLEKCAPPNGRSVPKRRGLEKWCAQVNPPEFGLGRPWRKPANARGPSPYADTKAARWRWYFGQFPWELIRHIRQGDFIPDRDYPAVRRLVRRWRHPNGLVWAMAIADYGRCGAWTETLGVVAPFQEMMLQSWDGSLRVFPAWPANIQARFVNFRAQGAFLVTASWRRGRVRTLKVFSEKGSRCSITPPWPGPLRVLGPGGKPAPIEKDSFGRPCFQTRPGATYSISQQPPH